MESHGSRWSLVFTWGGLPAMACHCKQSFFYTHLTKYYLNSAGHTFLIFPTTNGQASADTDKIRDTERDQTQCQHISTQTKISNSLLQWWIACGIEEGLSVNGWRWWVIEKDVVRTGKGLQHPAVVLEREATASAMIWGHCLTLHLKPSDKHP